LYRVLDVPEKQVPVSRFHKGAAAHPLAIQQPAEMKHDLGRHDGALQSLTLNANENPKIAQSG
jgi:hypothetical protein